jgi:hypothetical protein
MFEDKTRNIEIIQNKEKERKTLGSNEPIPAVRN